MTILDNIYGAFDYIFSNWLIALFLLFAVLLVLTILFKGLKLSIKLIFFGAIVAAIIFVVSLVIQMIKWDLLEIIDFVVKWGPTIIFVTIVLLAMLIGMWRGFRKSLILFIHASVACVVSIILFYYFVHSESFDSLLLSAANSVMGSTGALQDRFNLDPSINKMSDVLVEMILTIFKNSEYQVVLRENSAYLYALTDTVYHIIFAIICIIIYNIIKAILYLFYLIFYSERKYKKRKEKDFSKRLTDHTYRKHRIGGSVVGLVRGSILSLLILSCLGSTLYLFVGRGDGKLKDYDLNNSNNNRIYSIFRSVESYGTTGIFKVLNLISDEEGTPYYLFAADLVFSGELEIEGEDTTHIKWRDEIANLTTFARDTFTLMMEYGSETLIPIINGESEDFEPVYDILANPDFQKEFNKLIEGYKEETHVVNFSLALAQSLIDHIDELTLGESLGDTKEVVKVVFTKGYLSESIPEDRALIAETGINIAEGKEIRPYIPVANLIEKSDVQLVLNVLFKYLSDGYPKDDTLTMVRQLVGDLRGFSLFSNGRSKELDPVFSRLFCLVDNMYMSGEQGMAYEQVKDFDVKWTNEINGLIDVIESGIQLYQNVSAEQTEENTVLDAFFRIFDTSDEYYDQNAILYSTVTKKLYDSQVIGIAVSTSYMYNLLSDSLKEVYPDVYLSHNMTFTNRYDADGNLETAGELYLLFNGLARIGSNKDLVEQFTNVGENTDITALLKSLGKTVSGEDADGHNLTYYVSQSSIIRSLMTAVLTNLDTEYIYIPDGAFEKEDGVRINVITGKEVKGVLDNIDGLIDIISPLLDTDGDGDAAAALEAIGIESVIEMTERSKILEGSISSVLNKYLKENDFVIIPRDAQDDLEKWVSNGTAPGELRRMLDAIATLEIDFSKLIDSEKSNESELIAQFINLTDDQIETILKSRVLHYTISNMLIVGNEEMELDLAVPKAVRTSLTDDSIDALIWQNELKAVFAEIRDFELIDPETNTVKTPEISNLLTKVTSKADHLDNSKIVFAFIVDTIVNNNTNGLVEALQLSQKFIDGATRERLENMSFTASINGDHGWYEELPLLIKAMDEFLGITKASGEEGGYKYNADGLTQENLTEVFNTITDQSSVDTSKTRLDVIYASEIFKNLVTIQLDSLLGGFEAFEDTTKLNVAKVGGYYAKAEVLSLANAVDIFKIDLNGGAASLSHNLAGLNEPYDKSTTGQTKLEAVYGDSKLIARMFTFEIDKSLREGKLSSEDAISNAHKRNAAKSSDGNYTVEELQRFIAAAEKIGIDSVNSEISFSDNVKALVTSDESEEVPLESVYSSTIAAGIISYQVETSLKDADYSVHSRAFEDNIHILKYSEISSLLSLDFMSADGTLDGKSIDVATVGNLIYDADGETASYLLVGILSDMLEGTKNFTVVREATTGGYIAPKEIRTLLDVFSALGGDGADFGEFDIKTGIPEAEVLEMMYGSVLCRVKVTELIVQSTANNENNQQVFVSQANGVSTADDEVRRIDYYHRIGTGGAVFTLTTVELKAFVDAMKTDMFKEVFEKDGEFEVPEFTMDSLEKFDDKTLDLLFESEMMRYQICGAINFSLKEYPLVKTMVETNYGEEETVIDVTSSVEVGRIQTDKIVCYKAKDIKAISTAYKTAQSTGGNLPVVPDIPDIPVIPTT